MVIYLDCYLPIHAAKKFGMKGYERPLGICGTDRPWHGSCASHGAFKFFSLFHVYTFLLFHGVVNFTIYFCNFLLKFEMLHMFFCIELILFPIFLSSSKFPNG